jgi:hypothetical protein
LELISKYGLGSSELVTVCKTLTQRVKISNIQQGMTSSYDGKFFIQPISNPSRINNVIDSIWRKEIIIFTFYLQE